MAGLCEKRLLNYENIIGNYEKVTPILIFS